MTNEDLGRLLSLISHEIRAPIGVIRGYLRLLEQHGEALTDMQRTAVGGASKAGDRATDILNQLSALARLQRGEVGLQQRPVAIERLLRSALLEAEMPPQPIVTAHVADATPDLKVAGDEALLRSALAGFITAVARAQPADARIVLSAAERPTAADAGVMIRIAADKGARQEYEERPLDLLRGGLGLLLPIAAFVIDAHHGTVGEERDEHRLVGYTLWLPSSP